MFLPSESPGWQGNLKRYSLTGDKLLDVNKNPAIDANGAFLDTSQSFWTDFADGADITLGGAAAKINHVTRKAVTYTGNEALFHDDNELASDNDKLNIFLAGDAVNVAPLGTARQSSIGFNGFPSRAIDNNTNGNYGAASVTHTNGAEPSPWWELTLASPTNIERIVLHLSLIHI